MTATLFDSASQPINRRQLRWPVFAFIPFTTLILLLDSRVLWQRGLNGQWLANALVIAYVALLIAIAPPDLRLLILLIIPISTCGELLCSTLLRLYTYKFDGIPLYVPFGHAVLFSTGWLLSRWPWTVVRARSIQMLLVPIYAILLPAVVIFSGDTLTLVLGPVLGAVLWYKRAQPLYLMMGLLVLFAETTGARLGCWTWSREPLHLLHSTNPPAGAVVFYVLGDLLTMRVARIVKRPGRRR